MAAVEAILTLFPKGRPAPGVGHTLAAAMATGVGGLRRLGIYPGRGTRWPVRSRGIPTGGSSSLLWVRCSLRWGLVSSVVQRDIPVKHFFNSRSAEAPPSRLGIQHRERHAWEEELQVRC